MKILEPFSSNRLQLKNRLVFPAFETNWATEEGRVTPELIHLWRLIAEGGCGLLVVQCTNVNPNLEHRHTPYVTSIHEDSYISDYRKAVDAIKDVAPDAKIAIQLADKSVLGRHITIKELTLSEISLIVEYFAQAGRRAKEAGFDAVEFHAAHLYTLAEFLSKKGNNRPVNDPYGNTKDGRIRIHQEIIKRTRELAGDIAIIYRYSGDEFIVGGNTIKDGIILGQGLEEAGVDILSISAGGRREDGHNGYSATRSVPRAYYEDACNVHIAERIKKHVSIPVITAGKIGTIDLANQILEEGKADLVAMGRQQFHDPFTLKKYLEGRENEISKCVWCRKCHISYLADGIGLCGAESWKKNYMPAKFRGTGLV